MATFKLQDMITEAKNVLSNMKQGNCTFSDYLTDFETWSSRTGWSEQNLFNRLKSGLSARYVERLYNYSECALTYDKLVSQCRTINLLIMDLNNTLKATPMSQSALHAFTPSDFVHPNVIEVDASYMDKVFVNVLDYKTDQAI